MSDICDGARLNLQNLLKPPLRLIDRFMKAIHTVLSTVVNLPVLESFNVCKQLTKQNYLTGLFLRLKAKYFM